MHIKPGLKIKTYVLRKTAILWENSPVHINKIYLYWNKIHNTDTTMNEQKYAHT